MSPSGRTTLYGVRPELVPALVTIVMMVFT
jgi:hypothetical protein